MGCSGNSLVMQYSKACPPGIKSGGAMAAHPWGISLKPTASVCQWADQPQPVRREL